MRFALVSDIHGNLSALEAVVADIRRRGVELVLHGGDLALMGPRPAEVVDRIAELGWAGLLLANAGSVGMPWDGDLAAGRLLNLPESRPSPAPRWGTIDCPGCALCLPSSALASGPSFMPRRETSGEPPSPPLTT